MTWLSVYLCPASSRGRGGRGCSHGGRTASSTSKTDPSVQVIFKSLHMSHFLLAYWPKQITRLSPGLVQNGRTQGQCILVVAFVNSLSYLDHKQVLVPLLHRVGKEVNEIMHVRLLNNTI